jgi:hypothetical protein
MSTSDESKTGPPVKPKRMLFPAQLKENKKGKWDWFLKFIGFYSEEAVGIRSSVSLYMLAREQSALPEFQQSLGRSTLAMLAIKIRSQISLYLSYLFSGVKDEPASQYYLECLHIWMILVRLRKEGKHGKFVSQEVFDRFFEDELKQVRL